MTIAYAEKFLRAGTVTLAEWQMLTADQRAAFAVAGDRLWRERMTMMALALRAPEKFDEFEEGADAEDQIVRSLLESSVESARERFLGAQR